jgi:hypothetical protein
MVSSSSPMTWTVPRLNAETAGARSTLNRTRPRTDQTVYPRMPTEAVA